MLVLSVSAHVVWNGHNRSDCGFCELIVFEVTTRG